MNKIAAYLNEHVSGEVSSLRALRRDYSVDGSILSITPEIVLFPALTNDIRKTARFSWQMAEKGHVLPLTIRGGGTDTTGAAIGKGIVIDISKYLNSILHIAAKERIIHLQAGAKINVVNEVLQWHGLDIGTTLLGNTNATIGGWLGTDASSGDKSLLSKIDRLEVILANGDVIETGKMSRREVNRKQGLQTLEGEIYRKLDGILEDNADSIASLAGSKNSAGYAGISRIKAKDGSIDLTPLFIGTQGTLGIISEVVLKADFFNKDEELIVAQLVSKELAGDIVDQLRKLDPSILELLDGELFDLAEQMGNKYPALDGDSSVGSGSVVVIGFNDYSDRARHRKVKKAVKILKKHDITFKSSIDDQFDELEQVRRVVPAIRSGLSDTESIVPVIDGAMVPDDRREEFIQAVSDIADRVHVILPTRTDILTGAVDVYPILHLGEVSDKQKIFRLLKEYSQLVDSLGGAFIGNLPEGRLRANTAWELLDDQTKELFSQVKNVFDPFGILNPDVKQPNDLKQLVSSIKSSH